MLRIIPPQDQHKLKTWKPWYKAVNSKEQREWYVEIQLIPLLGCFHTFWGEIPQFDPRRGSAARLRDLLIVLVLLDLVWHNGSQQCHGSTFQVDYRLSAMGRALMQQYTMTMKWNMNVFRNNCNMTMFSSNITIIISNNWKCVWIKSWFNEGEMDQFHLKFVRLTCKSILTNPGFSLHCSTYKTNINIW